LIERGQSWNLESSLLGEGDFLSAKISSNYSATIIDYFLAIEYILVGNETFLETERKPSQY